MSPDAVVDGPFFEDLHHGQRFGGPGQTLTEGLAAVHQAIVGCRSPLVLDHGLFRRVAGADGALAAANLVWDIAIGQSTVATHTVVANLFYRGVVFRRAPRLGDTLRTVTEHEGDTLTSGIEVERTEPLAQGGLLHLRSRVRAVRATPADVLDWRFVALFA